MELFEEFFNRFLGLNKQLLDLFYLNYGIIFPSVMLITREQKDKSDLS